MDARCDLTHTAPLEQLRPSRRPTGAPKAHCFAGYIIYSVPHMVGHPANVRSSLVRGLVKNRIIIHSDLKNFAPAARKGIGEGSRYVQIRIPRLYQAPLQIRWIRIVQVRVCVHGSVALPRVLSVISVYTVRLPWLLVRVAYSVVVVSIAEILLT